MKTLQLLVSLIMICILIPSFTHNAISMPDLSPQDLYKQSDMVLYGQVISKQAGLGSDYYYQIKVETYFKNPQSSDSITAAGHSPEGGHVTYPQFVVGDKAIFYINKIDGINTISPYSQIAGEGCGIHSFLGPEQLPGEPIIRGVPIYRIYIEDSGGNFVYLPLVYHTAIIQYDELWNNYPQSRTIPVTLSIKNSDKEQIVFNQTQSFQMQACSGPQTVQWIFVPTQIANYDATVTSDKFTVSMSFKTMLNATADSQMLLPLQQIRSGISQEDVKCKLGFQIILKGSDNSPTCIKNSDVQDFLSRSWAIKIIPAQGTDQSFGYAISDGHVEKAVADAQSKSLILSINATANGTILVHLPRSLLDLKIKGQDAKFIVLEDGREVEYEQTTSSTTERTLSIPFQYDISEIEIIATENI